MVHYLTKYIYVYIYIYIYIYILIKKISVMHSLTKTLMPGVRKPGFPKWSRLVGGGNLGMKFQN